MEPAFWHKKWANNNIAFHRSAVNPLLEKHVGSLALAPESRIFLPLCGKTLDIAWFLSEGYRVAGAELSEIAIKQLFEELGTTPKIVASDASKTGEIIHYSAHNVDIFVGNIFQLSGEALGPVDAIYDRAALVALPADMRRRYTAHLLDITQKAPQLLICYEYDQSQMTGPPHSISGEEVKRHYSQHYNDLMMAESVDVPGGFKGKCAASENVWLLS